MNKSKNKYHQSLTELLYLLGKNKNKMAKMLLNNKQPNVLTRTENGIYLEVVIRERDVEKEAYEIGETK